MKNNNLIRFVQSLVFLPIMTLSLSIPGISNIRIPPSVLVKKVNIVADETQTPNQVSVSEVDQKAKVLNAEAEAINTYFNKYGMPLQGTGMKMVLEAQKNGIDWRLLPAIAVRESTGGKASCTRVKNNPFGWGSCTVGFNSIDEAIETLAQNLGGKNPFTAGNYSNKSLEEILHAYNPPSIVPRYAEQVMAIMKDIGDLDLATTSVSSHQVVATNA